MRINFSRLSNGLVFFSALLGILISIGGLYLLWKVQAEVTTHLFDWISLANRTLDATDTLLITTNQSLLDASQDLALMRDILNSTADTMEQSTQTVDDTAVLLGKDVPSFIAGTQAALTSTQSTALLIDDMMSAISNIPLIGPSLGSRYRPDIPLNEAVANVNHSLDPLPQTLATLQSDLQTAGASLSTIQQQMESLSAQIDGIDTALSNARSEVGNYQIILADTQTQLDDLEQQIPIGVQTVTFGITILLSWLALSQLGTLLQAVDRMKRND